VYNKNRKYRLEEYGTNPNVGYLEKADGKVIYHTAAEEDIEIKRNNMQVHLAVVKVSPEEHEGPDEEKILKVGHYIWEYYTTRNREAGELRVKLQNIKLRYDWRNRKYVVFIKYRRTWKSMYDPYITYHVETTPDHSEGYQLKL
jgi:hypothetical protein